MDVVLVGLPGTGKTEVGRRLAAGLRATFIDTDREVEAATGRSIDDVFRTDGQAAFRALDGAIVAGIGSADPGATVARVIATGGGTVIDPRNRWQLYRGRRVFWLDAPTSVLAGRLRRSPTVRPLLAAGDPEAGLDALRVARDRFYAPGERIDAGGTVAATVTAIEAALGRGAAPTPLLRANLSIGRVVIGEGIAASAIDGEVRRLGGARRIVLATEPRALAAIGDGILGELGQRGWAIEIVELPEGEPAKRMAIAEVGAAQLARLRVERDEPIVALGGGALTDAAGFIASIYQRGIPWVAVPTTLLGQLDAAHGGKTGLDLDEGKNLVGTFHLPAAVIVDPALLAALPERHRRAGLVEAVKDGVLGDERLLEVLEVDGPTIAAGAETAEPSALAEIVERAAWVKLEAVEADPTEQGDRIKLNLGHTLGHAIEAAAGYGPVLHGEAVAYGLRAAVRLGRHVGVTPAYRGERIEALLDRLALAVDPLPYPLEEVLDVLATDKKRRAGALRWVLPTADGWTVSGDLPMSLVREVAASVLAGRGVAVVAAVGGAAAGTAR